MMPGKILMRAVRRKETKSKKVMVREVSIVTLAGKEEKL